MTLAAVVDFNNLPIIIGDLLISGESDSVVELPTNLATGTGKDDLIRLVTTKTSTYLHAEYEPSVAALIECCDLLGKFLSQEVVSDESLFNYYGGGFEIAFVTKEDGIQKFSDITYLVFQFTDPPLVPEGTYGMALRHLSKNFYVRGHLVIRSVRVHDPAGSKTSENLKVIKPFHLPKEFTEDDIDLHEFPLKSNFYCLRFYFPTGQSFTCVATRPDERDLKITQTATGVNIDLGNGWIDEIVDRGRQYLISNTKKG